MTKHVMNEQPSYAQHHAEQMDDGRISSKNTHTCSVFCRPGASRMGKSRPCNLQCLLEVLRLLTWRVWLLMFCKTRPCSILASCNDFSCLIEQVVAGGNKLPIVHPVVNLQLYLKIGNFSLSKVQLDRFQAKAACRNGPRQKGFWSSRHWCRTGRVRERSDQVSP